MKIKRMIPWCTCTGDSLGSRKGWSYDAAQGTHVHHDCGKPSEACWKMLDENNLHPRR